MLKATYDIHASYDENYDRGPMQDFGIPAPIKSKPIKVWDYEVASPIGIPAGPLLNAKYIDLYGKLGFDIPVYKTLRTVARPSHSAPNCMYVDSRKQLTQADMGKTLYPLDKAPNSPLEIAITNSFGMPSKPIELWQADIEKANASLRKDQLMIVSCVGTSMTERSFVEDFVLCATKAVEAGAKAIELNFSCPNVVSKEGSIFQDPVFSSEISQAVKKAIKHIPLMIKIGYFADQAKAEAVIKANAPFVDGIAAINTISMQVRNVDGTQALSGEGRLNSGICGRIIKDLSLEMTQRIAEIRAKNRYDFVLCGVGGIVTPQDFDDYFDAGADIAMSATGAMWYPHLAHDWKRTHQK